jgi:hypothetical protein
MSVAVYECWPQILALIRTKQRDMNPYPVFVLPPSFTTNILAKFDVNFVPNKGRRTETGYIVSCPAVYFWVRARIRVSIHKQRHMGRQAEQPPVTSNSVCARQPLRKFPIGIPIGNQNSYRNSYRNWKFVQLSVRKTMCRTKIVKYAFVFVLRCLAQTL